MLLCLEQLGCKANMIARNTINSAQIPCNTQKSCTENFEMLEFFYYIVSCIFLHPSFCPIIFFSVYTSSKDTETYSTPPTEKMSPPPIPETPPMPPTERLTTAGPPWEAGPPSTDPGPLPAATAVMAGAAAMTGTTSTAPACS